MKSKLYGALLLLALVALLSVACAADAVLGDGANHAPMHAEHHAAHAHMHPSRHAAHHPPHAGIAATRHAAHHGGGGDVEHTNAPLEDAREIRVVATEFAFEPATIRLQEGEAVNIVLVNEGIIPHEIDIPELNFHVHAEAGETVVAGLTPERTGTFEMGCYIPGHFEAGMVGEVVVEPAP
ncbi:MAG: cupredoxin domain-containing protein [Candidatus Promineifilaceae bacterium]|nr:cupredoxin domain-containing protein [Candidatus Promineifilaceae bacterium]